MHFPGKEIPRNVDISDGEASHVSLGRKSTGCIKKVEERARPRADSVCPKAVDSFDPRCVVTSLHRPSLNFQMTRPRRKRILSLSLSLAYIVFLFFESLSVSNVDRKWNGNTSQAGETSSPTYRYNQILLRYLKVLLYYSMGLQR